MCFRKINFRSCHQLWKYFYNENFQIYGMSEQLMDTINFGISPLVRALHCTNHPIILSHEQIHNVFIMHAHIWVPHTYILSDLSKAMWHHSRFEDYYSVLILIKVCFSAQLLHYSLSIYYRIENGSTQEWVQVSIICSYLQIKMLKRILTIELLCPVT